MNAAKALEAATVHVGDEKNFFDGEEDTYSGRTASFNFPVRDLSSGGGGVAHGHSVLLFQSRNVNAPHNVVRVNGRDIGTMPPAVQSWEDKRSWSANVMVLHTSDLQEGTNTLEFEARPDPSNDDIDDFMLSDIAILHPTQGEGEGPRIDELRAELATVVERLERIESKTR